MLPEISRDKQLGILRKMLMIRRAEEHVIRFNEEYEGLIRGHFHVYIGQEGTGVAVCEALAPEDYVFSTHRNHGHVIAKGGDPGKVLAEIIGRETGYCRGRAGTFHVAAPPYNLSTRALGWLFVVYLVGAVVTPFAGRWIDAYGHRAGIASAMVSGL